VKLHMHHDGAGGFVVEGLETVRGARNVKVTYDYGGGDVEAIVDNARVPLRVLPAKRNNNGHRQVQDTPDAAAH